MYNVGDILAGCKLLKECGTGAFGSVFLAENLTTHQKHALKILYKHGNHHERELAGLIAYQEKCAHANLMRIYHVEQNDECIFYTMDAADNLNGDGEYLPDTLANRLRKRRRLEASELRPMLDELLNGLEILHGMGLLHRDIKPDNILWVSGHAVLGDIGLVAQNIHASMAGTPEFISPEVWNGKRDFAQQDDLYALAMTLYCALSGCSPRDYPDFPFSLTLGGGRDLIRMYNTVLAPDSQVRTVANFRSALALKAGKPRWILSKELLLYGFFSFLLLGGLIAWRISVERSFDRRQTEFTKQTIRHISSPQTIAVAIPPEKDKTQQIEMLASLLEQEWRKESRELLKRARQIDNSPIDLTQGISENETPQERRKRRMAEANERVYQLQNQLDDAESRLTNLKEMASVIVQYFGDVLDDQSPAMQKLKRHENKIANQFRNSDMLGWSYANLLLIRSRGGTKKAEGELGRYEAYLQSMPPDERRLFCRALVFQRLREDYLLGSSKMLQSNFDVAIIGNSLAMVSQYLNAL